LNETVTNGTTESVQFPQFHPNYPLAERGKAYDVYWNKEGEEIKIPDPYRALEKTQDNATLEWANKEVDLLEEYLSRNDKFKKMFEEKRDKYYSR
jgi:hypothetical protein